MEVKILLSHFSEQDKRLQRTAGVRFYRTKRILAPKIHNFYNLQIAIFIVSLQA
jgi:hypothetical protein